MSLDVRFGIAGVQRAELLGPLECGRGYIYDHARVEDPAYVGLIRNNPLRPIDLTTLPAIVRAHPGRWWQIGNEPNNGSPEAGDVQTPQAYADFCYQAANVLLNNDPTARLVGPAVLNWTRSAGYSAYGAPSGAAWSEALSAYYWDHYGPMPFHAWAIHTYGLTARPTEDWAGDIQDIMDCRTWLTQHGMGHLPIWITEFGAVKALNAAGEYDWGMIASYLGIYLPWLMSRGYWDYGVASWFLFMQGTEGGAPYTFAYDENWELSLTGRIYRDHAYLVNQDPRPAVTLETVPVTATTLRCTVRTSGGPMNSIDCIRFPAHAPVQVWADGWALGTPPGSFEFGQLGSVRARPLAFTFYASGAPPWTLPFTVRDCAGPWPTFIGWGQEPIAMPTDGLFAVHWR